MSSICSFHRPYCLRFGVRVRVLVALGMGRGSLDDPKGCRLRCSFLYCFLYAGIYSVCTSFHEAGKIIAAVYILHAGTCHVHCTSRVSQLLWLCICICMSPIPELPGNIIPKNSEQGSWLRNHVATLCNLNNDRSVTQRSRFETRTCSNATSVSQEVNPLASVTEISRD